MSEKHVKGAAFFDIPIVDSLKLNRTIVDRGEDGITVGTRDRNASPNATVVNEEVSFTIAELQSCAILVMEGNPRVTEVKGRQMGKVLAAGVIALAHVITRVQEGQGK